MAKAISISPATTIFSTSIPHLSTVHHRPLIRHAPLQRTITCKASQSTTNTPTKKKKRYEKENLTTWLSKQEQAGHVDASLIIVLCSMSLACKEIASLLQKSSIINLNGAQGTINIQGEDQKKLDVISNELFCNCLRSSGRTSIIVSEEEDVPVLMEEISSGNYIVVFDPIDGSSNIDIALTTGSIFGIYAPVDYETHTCITSVCQPGSNLLAAGYCLYSSSVVFTVSIGNGVYGFTLDPTDGEFVLTHEDIKIPQVGRTYSFNEGNYDLWDTKLQNYINHLRKPGGPAGKPYSGRYIGCLVGEIHRMLLYGGIYGNPQNEKAKNGNLRLLYECAPMSYLVEQAGGKAIDGVQRILDIQPHQIHQRTPIFIGSPDEIDKLVSYLA